MIFLIKKVIYGIIRLNLGYGMNIYDLLKEKANDIQFKDKLLYYDLEINRSYTFSDVYNLVNKYIDIFSKLDIKGKKKYLIVDNSVDSVALFIALLKCGVIPILINKDDLDTRGENITEYFNNIDNYDYEELFNNLKYDYIIANDANTFDNPKEELVQITNYIDRIEKRENDDCDFYICTSGVTNGIGKLIPLKDKELIERSLNCDRDYSILTTISISAISGIIYNVYRPIINNIKNYMSYNLYNTKDKTKNLKNIAYHHINRVLLPLNVIDLLDDELKKLDFSSLDRLYLTGGINNYETIDKLKEYLPNLDINAISNMYGRTENYGMICSSRGNNIKSLYINVLETNLNEMVYTFDKKHFYKYYVKDNKKIIEEVDRVYDDNCYANYLSVSDNVLDNIKIDDDGIFGEIIVDDNKTGDLGLYLNNQLFVLGRYNDLVTIDDNKYLLSMYEQLFSNITGLKTAAVLDEKTNKIFVVVDYKIDELSSNNFKQMIPLAKKCNEIIDKYHLKVEYPLFVPSKLFPRNKLMFKTNKKEITKLIENKDDFQDYINDYNNSFVKVIKNHILSEYKKTVNVIYQDNEFIFNKKEITFDELQKLERYKVGYTHFREDDNNYYFMIDDCALFNILPDINYSTTFWPENVINYIIKLYHQMKRDKFVDYYNEVKDRGKHYVNLKLRGLIYMEEGFYIFKPYQICGGNTHNYELDKIAGKDMPFIGYNKETIEAVYLENSEKEYYDNDTLQEKIKKYLSLLDHEYRINSKNLDYYIDGKKVDEKDLIYNELIDNPIFQNYTIFRHNDGSNNTNLSKNNIIIKDFNHIKNGTNEFINYGFLRLYDNFKIYGFSFRFELTLVANISFVIENIIQSTDGVNFDDIGLVVYLEEDGQLRLSNKPDMELFNETQKLRIKSIYETVETIRRMGKREIFVHGEKKEIDFSKLKLVILGMDSDISNIDYVMDIIDDCSIIDCREDKKVFRKEIKK